jgi:hypothetical protein
MKIKPVNGKIYDCASPAELESTLRILHLSINMLEWIDSGNGPIYTGLC